MDPWNGPCLGVNMVSDESYKVLCGIENTVEKIRAELLEMGREEGHGLRAQINRWIRRVAKIDVKIFLLF